MALIHCTHGFNRTGYMVASYLARMQVGRRPAAQVFPLHSGSGGGGGTTAAQAQPRWGPIPAARCAADCFYPSLPKPLIGG